MRMSVQNSLWVCVTVFSSQGAKQHPYCSVTPNNRLGNHPKKAEINIEGVGEGLYKCRSQIAAGNQRCWRTKTSMSLFCCRSLSAKEPYD